MTADTSDDALRRTEPALAAYVDKLARDDVDLYYALLFAPRAQRAALTALYTFWHEIRAIPATCSDAQVARVKLAWWSDEVRELIAGGARHPIARALAPLAARNPAAESALQAMLAAIASRIGEAPSATYADLLDDGMRGRGNVERLAATVVGCADDATAARAAEIGARLDLVALLRDAGSDAARTRCHLPREDLARFGVGLDDLQRGDSTEVLANLMRFEAKRLRDELDEHAARLPASMRPRLTVLLVATELARQVLRKIEAEGARALRAPPTLTPLRRLWIAWRAARHAAAPS